MELWATLARLASDGDPRLPGFQVQGWYLLVNLALPVLLGGLLLAPVRWIEKFFTRGRGGRGLGG